MNFKQAMIFQKLGQENKFRKRPKWIKIKYSFTEKKNNTLIRSKMHQNKDRNNILH